MIYDLLPPLHEPADGSNSDYGDGCYLLDGERAARQRRRNRQRRNEGDGDPFGEGKEKKPKGDRSRSRARARLICLYGVGDAAVSFKPWVRNAPDWLEVRAVELPGHGYLTATTAAAATITAAAPNDNSNDDDVCDERRIRLPPCAHRQDHPASRTELRRQFRTAIVDGLVRQLKPLVVGDKGGDGHGGPTNCAVFGFSFGALVGYEVCRRLQEEAEAATAPLPNLGFYAAGRGAPHADIHTRELEERMQMCGDGELMEWIGSTLGVTAAASSSARVPPPQLANAAARFRMGMLFSGLHAGDDCEDEIAASLWDELNGNGKFATGTGTPHAATGYARLNCPVVSITGSLDTIWPPHLVERWRDVAAGSDSTTDSNSCNNYRHFCLEGVSHDQLMNARGTQQVVFDHIRKLVLEKSRLN